MVHETARHAIHSFETLSVLAETVEAIQQQVIDHGPLAKASTASKIMRMHLDTCYNYS